MKRKICQLISLMLICSLFFSGCTSSGEATEQMNMDMKSAAYLLQFSGIASVMQYRLNVSDSEAAALPAKITLSEETFQKQVQKGREHLVKNAEILLETQENVLPNVLIYITSLSELGITQRHLEEDIFEKYRTANVSYYTCFNKANQTGTRTNFKALETTLQQGNLALADADEVLNRVQTAVKDYIAGYADAHQGWGWKSAFRTNQTKWDWLTAANGIISACSDTMELNTRLAECYYLCETAIYALDANGFSAETVSQCRDLLTTAATELEQLKAVQSEVSSQSSVLGVDAVAYATMLTDMQSFIDSVGALLGAMEAYHADGNMDSLSAAVIPYKTSYEKLTATCEEIVPIINSCAAQLMTQVQ